MKRQSIYTAELTRSTEITLKRLQGLFQNALFSCENERKVYTSLAVELVPWLGSVWWAFRAYHRILNDIQRGERSSSCAVLRVWHGILSGQTSSRSLPDQKRNVGNPNQELPTPFDDLFVCCQPFEDLFSCFQHHKSGTLSV